MWPKLFANGPILYVYIKYPNINLKEIGDGSNLRLFDFATYCVTLDKLYIRRWLCDKEENLARKGHWRCGSGVLKYWSAHEGLTEKGNLNEDLKEGREQVMQIQ